MKKDETVSQTVERFFSQHQAFSFKSEDIVLHKGDSAEFIYYLKSGVVKQTSTSPEGQEVTLTLFKPGAFFPLIWAIKNTPIPYELRAMTNGHGWKAPKEEVIAFLKKNGEVSFELATRLLSGLEGMSRKVEYALLATANHRVSEALLTLAYRFGKEEKDEQVRIDLSLTHQKIADITGLTRETVSRELKVLREQGLISIENQEILIPDKISLEESVGMH